MQCFKYNSHGNQICSGAEPVKEVFAKHRGCTSFYGRQAAAPDSLPVLLIPQFVPPRRVNQRLSMNVRQKTLMHLLLRAASKLASAK